jgi:Tol biopolymer transport system component
MTNEQMEPHVDASHEREQSQRKANLDKKVRALAVAAAMFLLAISCTQNAEGQNATTPTHEPSNEVPTVVSGTLPGPFFLDLRTGEITPLAENLAGGYSYAASPDGTRLAYGPCCDAEDWITVASIDGTDAHSVTPTEGRDAYAPHWSPDGTKLVYQLKDGADDSVGNLFVQDLSSGERTQLTDLELTRAWWYFLSPNFSPDGRNVIFQLPRGSSETTKWDVWSVPVTGGDPTLVLRDASFPMSFPDGKQIAFVEPWTNNFAGRSIVIADAEGSRRTLVEANDHIWWPTMSPDGSKIAYMDDDGSIYVVDVSTGESTEVADGNLAEWLDNDTLIVAPG